MKLKVTAVRKEILTVLSVGGTVFYWVNADAEIFRL